MCFIVFVCERIYKPVSAVTFLSYTRATMMQVKPSSAW